MNLDVVTSSENSLNDFLSPLSMERPRARNEGCSGLHNQKHFKYIIYKPKLQTSNSNFTLSYKLLVHLNTCLTIKSRHENWQIMWTN